MDLTQDKRWVSLYRNNVQKPSHNAAVTLLKSAVTEWLISWWWSALGKTTPEEVCTGLISSLKKECTHHRWNTIHEELLLWALAVLDPCYSGWGGKRESMLNFLSNCRGYFVMVRSIPWAHYPFLKSIVWLLNKWWIYYLQAFVSVKDSHRFLMYSFRIISGIYSNWCVKTCKLHGINIIGHNDFMKIVFCACLNWSQFSTHCSSAWPYNGERSEGTVINAVIWRNIGLRNFAIHELLDIYRNIKLISHFKTWLETGHN